MVTVLLAATPLASEPERVIEVPFAVEFKIDKTPVLVSKVAPEGREGVFHVNGAVPPVVVNVEDVDPEP
jgi:hypothetical protein